jgi:ABC-type lipoprotein release transport system permease subunit
MPSLVEGATRRDVLALVRVAALLMPTGLAAAGLPAWRVSRVEPITALRVD